VNNSKDSSDSTLFSKVELGSGLKLDNRIVMAPVTRVNADSNARFTAASRALVINEPAAQ